MLGLRVADAGDRVSLDDERWSFERAQQHNPSSREFGYSTYRVRDPHDVVHRVTWSHDKTVWVTLCGLRANDAPPLQGDEMLTCLHCIGEGG